jgi:hypothetical protein
MNQTDLPLQRGDYPPFLPYTFYEAPQYAAYRPATAITLTKSPVPDIAESAERKDEAPTKKTGRGAPRKVRNNILKPHLLGFSHPGQSLNRLPQFDHIVTGAVNTDLGGNTRPLSKKLIITLLRRLDVISAEAVEAYMFVSMRQCTRRHAQKIAQVLRVTVHAAAKVAETQWPPPDEVSDDHAFSSGGYITPCGSGSCTICSGPYWDGTQHGMSENEADGVNHAELQGYMWDAD